MLNSFDHSKEFGFVMVGRRFYRLSSCCFVRYSLTIQRLVPPCLLVHWRKILVCRKPASALTLHQISALVDLNYPFEHVLAWHVVLWLQGKCAAWSGIRCFWVTVRYRVSRASLGIGDAYAECSEGGTVLATSLMSLVTLELEVAQT